VSPLSSKDKNDYYQLLHDIEELRSEANKIVVMNNQLKGLNSWLKTRIRNSRIKKCSCREQKRDVRHKCYVSSIRNLLSWLPSDWHILSVGISVWTGLDLRGVTCGEDSDAQVSKELSESQIL